MAGSPDHLGIELSLDQCIKCNICTASCPVSNVTDLFPGPKYAGPQAGRFRIQGAPSPDGSVDYCSGCRVCNMVCPTGVKIAELNARARAEWVRQGNLAPRLRLRNNILARPELFGRLAGPFAPLVNRFTTFTPARRLAAAILGIHQDAPFPALARQTFTRWHQDHPRPAQARRQVVYFHGCSAQYFEPQVGRAVVGVLEANGLEVVVPPQNCCGLPLLSNGEFAAARKLHEKNIHHLYPYASKGLPILGASTSCTLTLKEEALELLGLHDEKNLLVAGHIFDINEFLLSLHHSGELNLALRPLPLSLPYHIPCQYRAHRLGQPGMELLALIPGLTVFDSLAACCGIAGTYGFKTEKFAIAQSVGKPLFDFVSNLNPPFVLCDSETCRWQITRMTGKPAFHPIELFAAAYGLNTDPHLARLLPA